MELALVVIGSLFVAYGLASLWVAWFRPTLAEHPMFSRTLLIGKIAPTRKVRTLAAIEPTLAGLLLMLLPHSASMWPFMVLLGIAFAASIALHLQRSDG
jgi:hypothetical protein